MSKATCGGGDPQQLVARIFGPPRTALPMWNVDREPSVAMSCGVTSVSGCTTWTAVVGMPSTSAAICAIVVSDAWPMSTVLHCTRNFHRRAHGRRPPTTWARRRP